MGSRFWSGRVAARLASCGLLLFSLVALGLGVLPARAAQNGAGLVVRHGDGRVVYAYVQFAEAKLSGLELLRRSGLTIVSANLGYGEGICAIGGEGCPADNCFCKSYGSPSVYWRYYLHRDGRWVYASLGPSSRLLGDGEIDGWEWSGGAPQLPAVTIAEIAARAGVTRATPGATATTPPTPLTPATPTGTPPPVPASVLPSPTRLPAPVTLIPAPATPPTTVSQPVMTPGLSTTRPAERFPSITPLAATTADPSPQPTPTPALTQLTAAPATTTTAAAPLPSSPSPAPLASVAGMPPAATGISAEQRTSLPTAPLIGGIAASAATMTANAAPTPEPVARAVVVAPDGQTTPLPTAEAGSTSVPPWFGYGVALVLTLVLTGYVLVARRRRATEEQADDAESR